MRPVPKMLSTVVVIDTTLPAASTTTKCEVPAGSWWRRGPGGAGPRGAPGAGAGPAASPISLARSAT